MINARDPFSRVVDSSQRWDPEWYSWVLEVSAALSAAAPATVSTATGIADSRYVICNNAGTTTLSLASASLFPGREMTIKTLQAQTVVAATSVVVPSTSATPGTAILPAVDGAWATLVSDGTNWIIMAAQPLV